MLYTAEEVFELMNEYGSRFQPFLFGIDFEVKSVSFTPIQNVISSKHE